MKLVVRYVLLAVLGGFGSLIVSRDLILMMLVVAMMLMMSKPNSIRGWWEKAKSRRKRDLYRLQ